MKRFLQFVVILAVMVSIFPLTAPLNGVKADSEPPRVVCVPWKGNESLPHPTWDGKEIALKGTVRYGGTIAYEWNFGDGSPVESGIATVGNDYPYPISAKHVYSGPANAEYVATLTVTGGAATDSDSYLVKILPQTLEVEADVAIDEGLWWLYQTQYRYTSGDVDLGSWGGWARVADTGSAVQAFENNLHKPFGETNKDPYVDCVRRGLNFLLSMALAVNIPPEDPYGGDTNGNGIGVACWDWQNGGREMYEVGIAMMAIVSSDTPGRVAVTGPAGIIGRTYRDIVQDMADYCAWAQNDEALGKSGIQLYNLTSASETQVTSVPNVAYPTVSSDKIVWMDFRSGNWDIYIYDIATGVETPLCVHPANQYIPTISVSGDKIAWADDRNGNYDIYMYDLVAGVEIPICTDPANQLWQDISGNKIVWMDDRNGNYDVYMYDLDTGIETPICVDPSSQLYPAISGDKIVWMDDRNGNFDIYMYDLTTGTETPVCVDPSPQSYPDISGDRIVWRDDRSGNGDIYMYDLSTSTETPICVHPWNADQPAISGDVIVWVDWRNGKIDGDIYAYDLATSTEIPVSLSPADAQMPDVCGDNIVWATSPGSGGDPNRVGGWRYSPNYTNSDNSVTQWPIMGMVPAEVKWGIKIADFVKPRLEGWLNYSQCRNPDWTYGGFGYTSPCEWVNVAKTAGTGIPGLLFCGVPASDERIQLALDFIDINWLNDNFGNGYAMYALKKAFDEFLPMESTGSHNWWSEYASYLVPIQYPDGHWDALGGYTSGTIGTTAWMILILTRGVYDIPPTAVAKVDGFDSIEVDKNQNVTFDGSQSTDGSYQIVKYEWDFESDGVYDATGMTVTHSYPEYGKYTVTLMVTDNRNVKTGGQKPAMIDMDTCTVWVHEPPHSPIADANGPYLGWPGAPVPLNGCGSWDPNLGDSIVVYAWDLDNDGVFETTTDTCILEHTWTAEGTFSIALMVQDNSELHLWSSEPYRTIVVIGNHEPVADPNGPYETWIGHTITLDGSASYDPDEAMGDTIVSYKWDLDNDGEYDDATGPTAPFGAYTLGWYTIRLMVTDAIGATGTAQTWVTVVQNAPPLAEADGPYAVSEGSCITLDGTGSSDPEGGTLTYAWDLNNDGVFETPGPTPGFCGVDGPQTVPVSLQVCDPLGACATDTSTVTINNVPPTVGPIAAPVNPVPVNTAINASGNFTDPGILDTHTALWAWGDGNTSPGIVNETNGSGSVAGSHTYTTPGLYTITLTVTDKDGGSGQSTYQYVVVYDPNGGFVTGGGWINSPPGAYTANPKLTGKANFGVDSKYKKGATVPTGNTEFQFQVGNLNFHSTSYQWLVVAGARAQYKGYGTINGKGNYGFMLTAIEGKVNGGGGVDKFRIKIWDKATNTIIYDNQQGAPDTANPTMAIAGGSIVIHK